jgi:uncharacterized membrane protein
MVCCFWALYLDFMIQCHKLNLNGAQFNVFAQYIPILNLVILRKTERSYKVQHYNCILLDHVHKDLFLPEADPRLH